jgi:hypothetical protein
MKTPLDVREWAGVFVALIGLAAVVFLLLLVLA